MQCYAGLCRAHASPHPKSSVDWEFGEGRRYTSVAHLVVVIGLDVPLVAVLIQNISKNNDWNKSDHWWRWPKKKKKRHRNRDKETSFGKKWALPAWGGETEFNNVAGWSFGQSTGRQRGSHRSKRCWRGRGGSTAARPGAQSTNLWRRQTDESSSWGLNLQIQMKIDIRGSQQKLVSEEFLFLGWKLLKPQIWRYPKILTHPRGRWHRPNSVKQAQWPLNGDSKFGRKAMGAKSSARGHFFGGPLVCVFFLTHTAHCPPSPVQMRTRAQPGGKKIGRKNKNWVRNGDRERFFLVGPMFSEARISCIDLCEWLQIFSRFIHDFLFEKWRSIARSSLQISL